MVKVQVAKTPPKTEHQKYFKPAPPYSQAKGELTSLGALKSLIEKLSLVKKISLT